MLSQYKWICVDAPLSSIGSDSGIYNTSTEGSNYSGIYLFSFLRLNIVQTADFVGL